MNGIFVATSGITFAWIEEGEDKNKAPTWLLMIEEKWEGSKFPILDHKDNSRNRCMVHAHLPFTNEKL
jgi:hypothetical protein